MANLEKYKGVIPAFYACYDAEGNVSPERVRALTEYHIRKGVKGVYVNGSSGECIYQSLEDRKITLENVMAAAKGRLTVIAHVGCNNTKDSVELAKHAESLGVDAIASIPPIYFHLPEYAIAAYWNAMSQAAPNTDFIIYNIPQLAGVALTQSLFAEMRKNPRVIGVKNSSMPVHKVNQRRHRKSSKLQQAHPYTFRHNHKDMPRIPGVIFNSLQNNKIILIFFFQNIFPLAIAIISIVVCYHHPLESFFLQYLNIFFQTNPAVYRSFFYMTMHIDLQE